MNFCQDITCKWAEVRQLVPQRDGTLQQELLKQQNNEMLRRQFADKANSVGPWIERQMDAVASIAMGMQVQKLDNLIQIIFKIQLNYSKSMENQFKWLDITLKSI